MNVKEFSEKSSKRIKVIWRKKFVGPCDHLAISPDERHVIVLNSGRTLSKQYSCLNKLHLVGIDGETIWEKDLDLHIGLNGIRFIDNKKILLAGVEGEYPKVHPCIRLIGLEGQTIDEFKFENFEYKYTIFVKSPNWYLLVKEKNRKNYLCCKNGESLWRSNLDSLTNTMSRTFTQSQHTFWGKDEKEIHCIGWEGRKICQSELNLEYQRVVCFSNGNIFAVGMDDFDDRQQPIYCFDKSGEKIFEKKLDFGVGDIYVSKTGVIFVNASNEYGFDQGRIYILKKHGEEISKLDVPGPCNLQASKKEEIIADGTRAGIHFFSADGELITKFTGINPHGIRVSESGRFLIGSENWGFREIKSKPPKYELIENFVQLLQLNTKVNK